MPTITAKKFFKKVVAIQFLTAASGATVSVVLTLLLRQQLGSDKAVSLAIAGFNVVALIFFLITVPVIREIHQRRSLDISLLLMPLVMLFLGFTKTPLELILLYCLLTFLSVIYSFNIGLYLKRLTSEGSIIESSSKMGAIYNSAWVVFPLVGTVLAARFGISFVFIAAAILGGIAYFLLPMQGMPRAPIGEGLNNPLKSLKVFFCNRFRVQAFINALGLDFIYGSWFLITLLLSQMGASASTIGIITLVVYLPWVIFEIPIGEAADRKIPARLLFVIGYGIMAITTVLMGLTSNLWLFTGIYFLCVVGSTGIEQIRTPYFLKHLPKEENGLLSIFLIESPLGRIAAPLLVYFLLQFMSLSHVLVVFGVLIVGFVVNALLIKPQQ